ncbi:MAG: D-alanyl-D-alanine carboxypeptidase [Oscillospiraceae bacterium]|nr:D-alanyl-D-alanine carboxypeptidase [Oscillospiraceae bacterium]
MKNKIIAVIVIFVLVTLSACETSIPYGWNRPPFEREDELHSQGVYVVDVESGAALFAKNETARMNPASTVKIMTALVTLEEIGGDRESLSGLIEVPHVVFAGFDTADPNTQGGSMAGLTVGQNNLTYLDALYGLMLPSGNDAANTLAYNVGGGSIAVFVDMMNDKADDIGCVNTSFANPHGLLEDGNWSCAYDLAVIARYAYEKFPLFREICGSTEYFMPGNNRINRDGYRVRNSNGLMWDNENNLFYRDYVRGVKNGALDYIYYLDGEGGWEEHSGIANLVSLGEIDGRLYIISTLEAPYKYGQLAAGEGRLQNCYSDHVLLYDWLLLLRADGNA